MSAAILGSACNKKVRVRVPAIFSVRMPPMELCRLRCFVAAGKWPLCLLRCLPRYRRGATGTPFRAVSPRIASGPVLILSDSRHLLFWQAPGPIGRYPMKHKGVEYTVAPTTTPDVWKYEFRIGDEVRTGTTSTRISQLAVRRVQLQIDRALNAAARKSEQ